MSIWSSLLTGSSGLGAYGDAIGIVGDNIANVSTVGFRASRAGFRDLLGGFGANGQRLGAGVQMSGAEVLYGQGSLLGTGRSMDMAINGNGFYVVRGQNRGIDGTYYSRDGRFGFDREGFLVNGDGLRLQGYAIDPQSGALSSALSDLELADQSPPAATTSVDLFANLDASSAPPALPWDPADPVNTSNHQTSVTVYDSLGQAHRVDVYFTNTGGGAWEWHAMVDGAEISGGAPGTPAEIAGGTLAFDANGALVSETANGTGADFLNAAPGQIIDFDFGTSIAEGGSGLEGSTQFASAFDVTSVTQDGFEAGTLVDLRVADDGTVTALYSNGDSRSVARVALATFASEAGLVRAGNQLFSESKESGQALVGAAGTGGRGSISAGFLEGSNVDLGSELVTLIAYQRAFQANARTVTTADEMLAETMNIKR
jgi:flagellar hook protein FlgE